MGEHCGLVHCHKYKTDYILEYWGKRLSLKKRCSHVWQFWNRLNKRNIPTSVFSKWKLLRVLIKARINIVACAVYTYLCFSYTCTLLFCWKMKSCCDRCFPQQIRPQITVLLYILRDYSSARTGFNMINKYFLSFHHVSLNRLSFDHYCFTQS